MRLHGKALHTTRVGRRRQLYVVRLKGEARI